jgi:hypothetical protein
MQMSEQKPKPKAWAIPLLIGIMLSTAFGIAVLVGNQGEQIAANNRARDKYIQEHNCVVADLSGRQVSRYRCDKPAPAVYVDSLSLQSLAEKEFPPTKK